jgi:hypothetical protein
MIFRKKQNLLWGKGLRELPSALAQILLRIISPWWLFEQEVSPKARSAAMRTQGIKVLDPVMELCQIEWLVLPVEKCRDADAEQKVIHSYFRRPHEPWGPERAFVLPVRVRRSRRRVLFRQESGLEGYEKG